MFCVDMQTKIALYFILVFVWLSIVTVSYAKNITKERENCTELFDLCNGTALNATVDIRIPSGCHYMHQQPCLLQDKTSIKLIGSSSNDTIIECKEPFNIVFMRIQNVTISNITMVNCGNVVNGSINQTVYDKTNNGIHFGSNFKFAIMFYQVKDITITNFRMDSTVGYGIVAFNAIGNITISEFNVLNTFPKCNGYDYHSDTADFNCSGSGLFMIYHNSIELGSVKEANTAITIDHSNFTANRNYLPYSQFSTLVDAINTGFIFNETSIPLQGAAAITMLYQQDLYDVNVTIRNSVFHNNNGNLSANIAIASLSTTRGKTLIQNSSFSDSNRANKNSFISSDKDISTGGISYYYLSFVNKKTTTIDSEILKVIHCNFTKLGGALGAAFHIEKVSVDTTSLLVRIEQCNFTENEADTGSAVYAVDRRLNDNLTNGLNISFVNVSAENNTLSPGSSVESSSYITGVFHSDNCHFKFDCIRQCNFINNQPSVFFGRSAYFTISGKARFLNNTSRHGGGMRLLNTVVFIHQGSDLYFYNNSAITRGGAIAIYSFNTNIQSQDICPIQFIGSSNARQIFHIKDINRVNNTITFENNTAGPYSQLQSIYANVFYVCNWYSYTLTQIYLGKNAEITNGTREAVYNEIFSFIPSNKQHLSILGYLPCPCDENKTFDADIAEYCLKADLNNTLKLGTTVIVGRSFTISLIILDVVGSIGHSTYLYSRVSSANNTLMLHKEQLYRPFSVVNRTCTPIDFTIYSLSPPPANSTGVLHLSLPRSAGHNLHFSFDECPIGFNVENISGLFACTCGKFFNKSPIKEDFQCDSVSGKIKRIDVQSWLSVINDTQRVEYTKLCLPEYCNNSTSVTNFDMLCNPYHTGRGCGKCVKGFGKTFGSNVCSKECTNFWLFTILLYGILGIILVLIIHLLKLTVTMGTINGLIFFCNIMSINDSLFFNPSTVSFVRIFISLINLDLGFKMCFYSEMSQIVKIGLQFVFPLYLWLLMFIIVMVGKYYMRIRKSTHSAVPVLATLILLSYSKLLRVTISIFSSVTVYYSTKESSFSRLQWFLAWRPDPSMKYLEGTHIALFLVALIFTMLFIFPLTFALTFPKVVLRSKKLSYFFPLLDCVYAPYKIHCRFWFGMRFIVLIYFSGMESILLSYQNSLLLSGVVVILLFTLMQACIHPFKSTLNNTLDLMFMGLFITLAIVVLYLYPNTSGNEQYIAVNILGGVAFLLFCFIIIFHLHDALMHFTCYLKLTEALKTKFNVKKLKESWNPLLSINTGNSKSDQSLHPNVNGSFCNYAYLRESLLEEQFT